MKCLMILLLLALIQLSHELTCRNYDNDHCVSVGCDVHCQALGKKSGYCGYSGSGCTCYCVRYDNKKREIETIELDKLSANVSDSLTNITILENKQEQPCDCMYGGQCYTCGAQINTLVCVRNCGWKSCIHVECINSACQGRWC